MTAEIAVKAKDGYDFKLAFMDNAAGISAGSVKISAKVGFDYADRKIMRLDFMEKRNSK